MANGRNSSRNRDTSRDAGGFIALPWSVLDCPAYACLSHPARTLLFEFARQFVRDNNGRLLASAAYLGKRGWKSADVITRAKRELLDAGFIFETVKGQRPNKASWYAVTWRALDKLPGYDAGATTGFERSAYQKNKPLKNTNLTPPHGVARPAIAPSHGVEGTLPIPSHGANRTTFDHLSIPSHGNHLEKPSVGVVLDVAVAGDASRYHESAFPLHAIESQQISAADGDFIRQSDSDVPAECWHEGEPCKPPVKVSAKSQIIKAVGNALATRSRLC